MSTSQVIAIDMKFRQFARQLQYSMIALVLMSLCSLRVWAQDGRAQDEQTHAQHQEQAQDQQSQRNQQTQYSALIKTVREATERFKDVKAAEYEGYRLEFGCVSGPDEGAMGLHYVNDTLVGNGVIDPMHPQIVLYEAQPNGRLKLTGADFVVLAADWDAKHPGTPPMLGGQIFHYFEYPNRFGLPAFYTLHVWAWKPNPNGAFVNWHPDVSCQSFVGQTTP
jgi:hypothetical protein